MRVLRFHPEADEELTEAREWYEARSEVAAQAFALEVDHALAAASGAPLEPPPRGRAAA